MMKAFIPRAAGQGNKANGRPTVRISRPIPILAPHPVSSSIGQRLAQNVLSINDDETLPPEFRNLHRRPSAPDGDMHFDLDAGFQNQSDLREREHHRHIEMGASASVARQKKELGQPRLIARLDSSKKVSGNAPAYVAPRAVNFPEPESSKPCTPYPADTLTELEYRDVIRTHPKRDSDLDSQIFIKHEQGKWESAKARLESAKEDVLAKLGIKTKRVRDAEKLGYTPLTRHAKAAIPNLEDSNEASFGLQNWKRSKIEQWRHCTRNEDTSVKGQGIEEDEEEMRAEANARRVDMTTAAGHAIACSSMRERLIHLKERAFRSKPELRAKI